MSRHTSSPDFEPRIADWLESDPDRAPAEVLPTVLAAYPLIPQRRASRVPGRLPTMPRFALIGAAAATVAVVGLGVVLLAPRPPSPAVISGPGISPSATPSTSPSASPGLPDPSPDLDGPAIPVFDKRTDPTPSGLSLGYPTGWAIAAPPADGALEPTDSLALTWGDASPGKVPLAKLYAYSVALQDGETADEWIASQTATGSGLTCPVEFLRDVVRIGDRAGVLVESNCGLLGGRRHYRALAVVGQRGYTVHMDTTILDRAWFEALLASVDFGTGTPQD